MPKVKRTSECQGFNLFCIDANEIKLIQRDGSTREPILLNLLPKTSKTGTNTHALYTRQTPRFKHFEDVEQEKKVYCEKIRELEKLIGDTENIPENRSRIAEWRVQIKRLQVAFTKM